MCPSVVYNDQHLGAYECESWSKYFILTSGLPSVNRLDLQALTLVGPVLDPVAVLRLDN